jgi:hypothetical protein
VTGRGLDVLSYRQRSSRSSAVFASPVRQRQQKPAAYAAACCLQPEQCQHQQECEQ